MELCANWIAVMKIHSQITPQRTDGYAELGDYAAIGEGRSVALIAPDGAMTKIFDNLCDNGNIETFNEMFDVNTGLWRGNLPQGLSHLALICAAAALSNQTIPSAVTSRQRGTTDDE